MGDKGDGVDIDLEDIEVKHDNVSITVKCTTKHSMFEIKTKLKEVLEVAKIHVIRKVEGFGKTRLAGNITSLAPSTLNIKDIENAINNYMHEKKIFIEVERTGLSRDEYMMAPALKVLVEESDKVIEHLKKIAKTLNSIGIKFMIQRESSDDLRLYRACSWMQRILKRGKKGGQWFIKLQLRKKYQQRIRKLKCM